MENESLLAYLRDLNLEEGQARIRAYAADLTDHAAFGVLLKDEALHQQNADPFLSLKLAELLIYFGEFVQHAPSHALGLIAKGNALGSIGYHQASIECLDAAGAEFLRLGDEIGWARSRIMWIYSCACLGRTEEALQGAAQARAVFERYGEFARVCTVDHNTAIIYTQTGQYQKALDTYEKILAIYPTLTGQGAAFIKNATALAKYNQARNLSWLGAFEQASSLLKQARASFVALEEMGRVVDVDINLADLDYAQGYYGSALRRYYQVRDSLLEHKLDDSVMLAWMPLKIATCLVKLNREQEACQLAAKAVEVQRGRDSLLDMADTLREFAALLITSGRLQEALAALDEAQVLFARGKLDHIASTVRLQQAELLLEMGSTAAAYAQARLLKEEFDARGLVSRAVRASLVMAGSLLRSARQPGAPKEAQQSSTLLQEAVLLATRAASLSRQHNLQELVYKSQHLLGQLAALQPDLEKAGRHYKLAIAQVERMLNDLAYDLGPSFLRTAWTVYEDMIALCLQRGQAERAFNYLERARSMALRQYLNKLQGPFSDERAPESTLPASLVQESNAAVLRTRHELEVWQARYHKYSALLADINASLSPIIDRGAIQAELEQCEAQLNELFERLHLHQLDTYASVSGKQRGNTPGLRPSRRLDIAQLRRRLLPEQVLLAYYLHQGNLVIFAIAPQGLITHEQAGGAQQLERLLLLLHAHLHPGSWSDVQHPPQQVIRRLLNKLYDLLVAPVASLLPPPSGYLTIVPYGPLHTLPFHALFDGSRFLVEDFQINYLPASSILTHFGHPRPARAASAHVSAIPPLVFGYSGSGYLPRAVEEAKSLSALLDGRCYLEEEATITHLIEESPGSPVIHLATHGKSRLDAPNFSYVRLADGQLNALDAFSLDLRACELVTLSGCETGLALSGGGDEQLGLGRAFLAAGAASLVMSLWAVEDTATNELMRLFYQHLLQGDTKVQALRAAQCMLLQQASSPYTHPYFWASFRLVGDAGQLFSAQKA